MQPHSKSLRAAYCFDTLKWRTVHVRRCPRNGTIMSDSFVQRSQILEPITMVGVLGWAVVQQWIIAPNGDN
jgi:hypothetical protein